MAGLVRKGFYWCYDAADFLDMLYSGQLPPMVHPFFHKSKSSACLQGVVRTAAREALVRLECIRGLRSQVQSCVWNINTKLMPFVHDPQAFRSILGASEALIYGDFATEFFSRTTSKTLAIMAKATKADPVQAYLQTQGYLLVGEERVRLGSVTRLRRGELFIILRKTRLIPIQAILSRTPTTQAMNFIAWNKAYSVFPKTTFLDHEVLPLKGAGKDVRAEIARCGESGWCLGVNASPHQELSRSHRRIGDSRTWKMNLDTLCVTQPGTPTAVLEYSSFGIQQPTVSLEATWYQLEEGLKYSISVKPLTSQVLKYRYTCSRQEPPSVFAKYSSVIR
ncbi:uncharacterized protein PG986_014357 [Apiospora aurea]|uniref:Uncharacterized protein n=1 Tax=Apiospora aurea TaxID=335848 RepID=A0ABR1PSR0_9PEZI